MFPFNMNVAYMPLTYLLDNNNNNVCIHKGKTGYFLLYYKTMLVYWVSSHKI